MGLFLVWQRGLHNITMKIVRATRYITILPDVTVEANQRHVKVTGKRGTLERTFRHIQVELTPLEDGRIRVDAWFSTRKNLASLRTICTHITNMMKGVKFGYRYALKTVYAHFPINLSFEG